AEAGRVDAQFDGAPAVVLLPRGAFDAAPAALGAVDGERFADRHVLDAVAYGGDGAGALVAEGERQFVGQLFGAPGHDGGVGVADAGGGDPEQHLAGTGIGRGNVDDGRGRAD